MTIAVIQVRDRNCSLTAQAELSGPMYMGNPTSEVKTPSIDISSIDLFEFTTFCNYPSICYAKVRRKEVRFKAGPPGTSYT